MDIVSTDPYGAISPPRHVLYLRQLKRLMDERSSKGMFFIGPQYDPFLYEFHDSNYVRAVRDDKDSLENTQYKWTLLTFEEHWNYAACVYHAAREAIETCSVVPVFAPNQGMSGFNYGRQESVFNGEASTAIRMYRETKYRVMIFNAGPVYPHGTSELIAAYPEIKLVGPNTSTDLSPDTRYISSLNNATDRIVEFDPQLLIATINPSWSNYVGVDKFLMVFRGFIDKLKEDRRAVALILGNPAERKAVTLYRAMIQAVWG